MSNSTSTSFVATTASTTSSTTGVNSATTSFIPSSSTTPSGSASGSSTYASLTSPPSQEYTITANSTAPGKKYNTATQRASVNATSTGLLSIDFVTFTEQQSTGSGGLSSGAIAGIAIATLLIGAAIATIAMFVVHRKKQRRRKSKPARLSAYTSAGGEHEPVKGLAVSTNEKSLASSNVTDPDYLLPQPKDDQTMKSAVKQLFVHIGDHAENFYHNNALRENVTPQSEDDELMIGRKTRHAAIKRYICREMLTAIGWKCTPAHSLLSAQAVSMAQQMPRGNLNENTYEVVWSRWRVSVGLLLKTHDQNQRQQAREYWVGHMQAKLQPFQIDSPDMRGQVQRDLYAICDLAENLATLICSQPARWEFDWPRSEGRKDLIIFPEFGRSTDSKARRLDRPSRVLDAYRLQ